MLRYLTERLPVMVTPRWVGTRIQPIAIRDVLRYLIAAARLPEGVNRTFDIGGPEVLTYREMMSRYAAVAELPARRVLPVPVLTPRLSSHWVNLVTPVPRAIAAPLIDSLVHEVVCREQDILEYVPDPPEGRIGYDRAVALALTKINTGDVETRWSDAAGTGAAADPLPSDPQWAGGTVYLDERERPCTAGPEALWSVVTGIGGGRGWYSFPLAWSVRGWLDRLVGGVGLRRGRRDPDRLHTGDALDWWRVERLEDTDGERLLRLRAEMKVPGRAWLELTVAARRGRGLALPPARRLPAPRAGRAPVLVGRRAVPRAGVRRHGPQHHAGRRTGRRRPDPRISFGVSRVNRRKVAGRDCPVTGRPLAFRMWPRSCR